MKQEHDAKIEKAGGIFRTHVIIKIGDHYKLDFGICISETCYRPFSHAELSGLEKVQNLTRVQHGLCSSRRNCSF